MAKKRNRVYSEESEEEDQGAWATSKSKSKTSRRSRSRSKGPDTNKTPARTTTPVTPPTKSAPQSMPVARPLALLVCSIGNPGAAYANTLHSAGHNVLNRVAERLGHSNFQKDKSLGGGLVSKSSQASAQGANWVLWQSTSFMNLSGKGVRAAWNTWSKDFPEGQTRLVVVHDELDKALGVVSVRTAQGLSARGHNGLKSLLATMGKVPFTRIGIGIGRPESRESNDVANYVLRKMTSEERAKVEDCADEVIAKLGGLAKG